MPDPGAPLALAAPSRTFTTVAIEPATRATHATASSAASRRALTPAAGMWWGVDSTSAITDRSLANVESWYVRNHRPQFWGRYLRGHFAVSRAELGYARAHDIYAYLIVTDRNCSQCGGSDVCGNDRTARQARADALEAVHDAAALGVPAGAVLFKDIEQVSSCRGEPTAAYLLAWYTALRATDYRTGFYGNTHRQYYNCPVAYCAAIGRDAGFAAGVVLDMNDPNPSSAHRATRSGRRTRRGSPRRNRSARLPARQ